MLGEETLVVGLLVVVAVMVVKYKGMDENFGYW